MDNVYYCKSKRIADYLIDNGSKLMSIEYEDGFVFVFKYDESIDKNLEQWEVDRKRCLF